MPFKINSRHYAAVGIDRFARVNPEYRNRIARHEAAHFLVGYMLGVPVAGYSLGLGESHIDFLEAKLARRLSSQPVVSLVYNVYLFSARRERRRFPVL